MDRRQLRKGQLATAPLASILPANADGHLNGHTAVALTARQAELLRFCVLQGYYRIPRRLTLRQLSSKLGISATSLSLALRRAEAKVMVAHAAGLPQPRNGKLTPTRR